MKKNKLVAGILAILVGGIGIHKFYLGRTGAGILSLLFCWTGIPAIIALIEGIIILCQSDEEFCKKYDVELDDYPSYTSTSKADELLKWKQLHDSGDISTEEYERIRERILR